LCESSNITDYVLGNVTYAVTITGEYLDGIWVIGIGWLRLQGGSEFAEVVVHVISVFNACNIKFQVVHALYALILWPDTYVVAFVLDAEVLEFLDGHLFSVGRTDGHLNRLARRLAIMGF
jgi:hypothetical protein